MKFQDFMCGLLAGWSQIIAGQPFDFIKVKYQIDAQASKKSMFQVAKQIQRQYGFLGFYRGASSLFFGFAFTIGLEFAVYEFSKRMIYSWKKREILEEKYKDSALSIQDVGLAGGIVGLSVSLIYCPVEYVKIKKQLNSHCSNGSLQLLFNEIRTNGLKNITKGLQATISREVLGSMFYYGMYEYTVRILSNKEREKATTVDYILSGGVAGLCYWIVSYPFDIVKTKVQNGASYRSALKQLLASSYRGFSAVFIRSILVNGVSFATYEHSRKLFELNQSSKAQQL